ncbi:MAG: DinB family protein [Candidatus Methanofastidiosia archaeon]|jgi:hypothetical protein
MSKKPLQKRMEASLQELLHYIEQVTDHEFNTVTITGSWTAKEVLSHIAAWDITAIQLSKELLTGTQVQWPEFDTFNAHAVSERADLTREEIVTEVQENRNTYIQFIQNLTESQLNTKEGGVSVRILAEQIVGHDYHHLQQIMHI